MRKTPDKPREYEYRDYKQEVETAGESALDAHLSHEDDLHKAIEYGISGSSRFTNYGHMLMTVLLSDQSPENPDYSEPWSQFIDFDSDPTWADVVGQMARVCYYSDVMDYVKQELEERPEEDLEDPFEGTDPIATWESTTMPDWEWEAYEVEETDAELVTDTDEDGEPITTEGTIYFGRVRSPQTYGKWEVGSFSSHDLREALAFRTDASPSTWPTGDENGGEE